MVYKNKKHILIKVKGIFITILQVPCLRGFPPSPFTVVCFPMSLLSPDPFHLPEDTVENRAHLWSELSSPGDVFLFLAAAR